MTTAVPSAALATIQPAFTDPERLALAGFLAGYQGLTREDYALDLRQFTGWCRARSLSLFAVRRANIEGFARELEVIPEGVGPVKGLVCPLFFPFPAVSRHAGGRAGVKVERPAGRP